LSPPHLSWLLAAPACGASNISAADSVTINIRMIWLPFSPNQPSSTFRGNSLPLLNTLALENRHVCRIFFGIHYSTHATTITRSARTRRLADVRFTPESGHWD
jgi:hypothetical protein